MNAKTTTLTIGHTADWHLGQNRHGHRTAAGTNSARDSLRRCADHVVTDALDKQLDAMLIVGDPLDKGTPSAEDVAFLQDTVARLVNDGVPVLIEDGNHGRHGVRAGDRGPASLLRAAGATVYSEPGIVHMDTRNGPLHVLAVPWIERQKYLEAAGALDVDPAQRDELIAAYIGGLIEDLVDDTNLPNGERFIATSHTTVSGSMLGGEGPDRGSETVINPAGVFEEVILPLDLFTEVGAEYVALGHIHQQQDFGIASYAGSIDRLTFGEAASPKGYLNVTLNGGEPQRELVATPARKMRNVNLAKTPTPDLSDLAPDELVKVFLDEGQAQVPEDIRKAVTEAGARLTAPRRRPVRRTAAHGTIQEGLSPLDASKQWAKIKGLDESMTDKVLTRLAGYVDSCCH